MSTRSFSDFILSLSPVAASTNGLRLVVVVQWNTVLADLVCLAVSCMMSHSPGIRRLFSTYM